MSASPVERRPRPARRSRRPVYWLAGIAAAAVVFGAGVALGEALHDNPTPGITQTSVRTIHPAP
jgi:anti-sigma factor RsiW